MSKNILILGIDGYLGWSLALYLKERGYSVFGMDNFLRRKMVKEIGSHSATPILSPEERQKYIPFEVGDMLDYAKVKEVLQKSQPEAIVHFGEQPSAPYSMIDVNHAVFTQKNNVLGTLNLLWAMREVCPGAQLIKLGCYDDKTEILTNSGWKLFKDLKKDDRVATRTKGNRLMKFKKPKSIHQFDYEGKMYKVKNNRLDLLVTPNHRMFTVKRSDRTYKELRLENTTSIYGEKKAYDIGLEWEGGNPSKLNIIGKKVSADLWVRFLGWYLSEGCCPNRKDRPNSYRIVIKQKDKENSEEIRSIFEQLAKALNLNFREHRDGKTKINIFILWGRDFAKYMKRFGKARDKYIPQEIKNLTPLLLKELLDSLIKDDGWPHHRGFKYFSLSKQLADDVQEVALKCGWAATISTEKGGYVVNISLSTYAHVNHYLEKKNDRWEDYRGKVYCVDVGGDGIILVRRNGKVVWCGNTMGTYGTPNIDIPEGFFEIEYRGRKDMLPFPKQAGSWYHQSKSHDSDNLLFACRTWGLPATDINQGPVYGTLIDEMKSDWQRTRYDFDHVFGTVLNRFCAQAIIGYPLTPYGKGGQIRGYININDTMQCIRLCIENPAEPGEYRVFNQWIEKFTINQLAEIVKKFGDEMGLNVSIQPLSNPRKEKEEHYYNPDNQGLYRLGLKPRGLESIVPQSLKDLMNFKERITAKRDFIKPTVKWA